jgi:diguanylate cyclase (GGDEF)-like protein/PAS domain S-box-containing protein
MSAFRDPEVLRNILESLPTGVCVVDMQKKIVLWSDGAERITGYLRHEVIGQRCISEMLLHCDQQHCEWCKEDSPLARAMMTSQPAEAVGFVQHKAGHEIPIRARAVPVHNARGSIIGAVETFHKQQAASPDRREETLDLPGYVDEVTNVASHVMMHSHLRETLGTFAEVHVPFGVLLFRLEGLERFRATVGPDAASSLLRVVARTLEFALWKTDFVGRWSDDQFLVILNGCREEALHSMHDRIQAALASDSIEWWGERRSLPVSVGETMVHPGDSIESLMERAEKSLTAASEMRAQAAAAHAGQSSGS